MASQKRVIILTGEAPEAAGGVEHVVHELTDGLRADGLSVDVFHSQNAGAPAWVAHPSSKLQNYARDFLLSWYLGKRAARAMNDDVVGIISNGPYGWHLPGIPAEVKKIHFYHGTYRGQAEAIRPFISGAGALKLRWWDSMLLERTSGRGKTIVCNSDQTRDEVARYFGFRGETVWLPLDTAHFAPIDKSAARIKLGLAESEKIGLFVGSSHPTKGFPIVRDLIGIYPDLTWILALRSVAPPDLRQNARTHLIENASRQLLPTLYNAADFSLCPSVYESFGYVVAEALACGTPVIASPGGASRRFLGTPPLDFALMNHNASAQDYVHAIDTILASPELYRRKVIEQIRSRIETLMAPTNWVSRFREAAGL